MNGLKTRQIGSGRPPDVREDDYVWLLLEGDGTTYLEPARSVAWDGIDGLGMVTAYAVCDPVASTNPKDAIGSHKLPLHLWPSEATAMGCLGLLEGREKYGRDNYVAGSGVIASIYVDACKRHLDAWFSGEENAPDSKLPHLAHALACLAILVKAQAHDKLIDDRSYDPNGSYRRMADALTPLVAQVQGQHREKKPKHWTIADCPNNFVETKQP